MTHQGVLGTGGDVDGNEGPFFPPACTGHCDYIGEGKPPPPTVPLAQRAGVMASAKQAASCHRSVRQGVGE